MKKTIALIMSLVFIVALFAGCGSGSSDESSSGSDNTAGSSAAQTDENSNYKFAAGKFATDSDGKPTEAYDYELPLSTTDESFSYWLTIYTPQYIASDGYGSMEYPTMMKENTGVNLEYVVISSDSRQENLSVLLASDDLCDIMSQANFFYPGSMQEAIDDNYFINIYDYKDYCPNYFYQVYSRDNMDVNASVFVNDNTVATFWGLLAEPAPSDGYCVRKDWLDKIGVTDPSSIDTVDEVHDVLTQFKNELNVQWPAEIFSTIELTNGHSFPAFNTSSMVRSNFLPYTRVVDGKVQFAQSTDDDLALITMLNQWFSEGLIDPNYASYTDTNSMSTMITNSNTGYVIFSPSEIDAWVAATADPNASWVALPRAKRDESSTIKYGQNISQTTYGSAMVSASCENIPLVVTYIDYLYSPEGSLASSWGPEGVTWEYNDAGDRQLTDFILNNEMGSAWALMMYACDAGLADPGLLWNNRTYAYAGGEKLEAMQYTWEVEGYQGEYDFPASLTFTDEENDIVYTYSNDLTTYINENYLAFLDGSKPLSDWQSYVDGLYDLGLQEEIDVYQEAYDNFVAQNA